MAFVRRVIALLALLPVLAFATPTAAHVREPSSPAVARQALYPSPVIALPDAVASAPAGEVDRTAPGARLDPSALAVALTAALLLMVAAGAALGSVRVRRVTAMAMGALTLIFIAESGPHLVHHALDPAQAEQCQMLKASSHSDATTVAADPVPVPGTLEWLQAAPQLNPPAVGCPAARGRAPPSA